MGEGPLRDGWPRSGPSGRSSRSDGRDARPVSSFPLGSGRKTRGRPTAQRARLAIMIVVGIDGSPGSRAALRFGNGLVEPNWGIASNSVDPPSFHGNEGVTGSSP